LEPARASGLGFVDQSVDTLGQVSYTNFYGRRALVALAAFAFGFRLRANLSRKLIDFPKNGLMA
jgi:hypothetical protein